MSFQLPQTTASGNTGFSFGLNTAATANAGEPKPAGQFSFGATGGGDAGAPKPLGFGLGAGTATSAAPTSTAPSLGLGGGGFLGAAAAPAATTSNTTAAAAPTFSFGTNTAAAAPVQSSQPAAAASLSLSKTTAPTLGAATTATTTASAAPTGFANLTTATKTTDSTAIATASQMSYNQLEEYINKWTLELEEQEKVFTDQATQINAWDKILNNNTSQILELNDAVQKVIADQTTLEHELEYIATQHKELEENLAPLEKEFTKLPQVDMERSQTYLMVENLDTQLKQMSEDLKEIIDNLNESNKTEDTTDPIIQIGKILNAHMTSLQWIESSSTVISNKLDEIDKMHETYKRDAERFRSTYYN